MASSRWDIRRIGDLLFTIVILAILLAALSATFRWPYSARLAPTAVGVPAALLCAFLIARGLWRIVRRVTVGEESVMDVSVDRSLPGDVFALRAGAMFAWVFGFSLAVWLFGFLPVVPVFVFLYVLLAARERWWMALLFGAGMFVFMAGVFHFILRVAWMRGQFNEPQRQILIFLNQLF